MTPAVVALRALAVALLHTWQPAAAPYAEPAVLEAIASSCDHEAAVHPVDARACVALMVVYGERESGLRAHPRAWSWDARSGLAVGPWQQWGAGGLTLRQQADRWLASLRVMGLARLDSSARRAAGRQRLAARLLASIDCDVPVGSSVPLVVQVSRTPSIRASTATVGRGGPLQPGPSSLGPQASEHRLRLAGCT